MERDLQSEKNVMKVWRNRLIARILRISAHEDLECLTKLGPEELFSKDEEVMSQVRPTMRKNLPKTFDQLLFCKYLVNVLTFTKYLVNIDKFIKHLVNSYHQKGVKHYVLTN